jgi:hypothetical protein
VFAPHLRFLSGESERERLRHLFVFDVRRGVPDSLQITTRPFKAQQFELQFVRSISYFEIIGVDEYGSC